MVSSADVQRSATVRRCFYEMAAALSCCNLRCDHLFYGAAAMVTHLLAVKGLMEPSRCSAEGFNTPSRFFHAKPGLLVSVLPARSGPPSPLISSDADPSTSSKSLVVTLQPLLVSVVGAGRHGLGHPRCRSFMAVPLYTFSAIVEVADGLFSLLSDLLEQFDLRLSFHLVTASGGRCFTSEQPLHLRPFLA